jgi:hypothetical protein
MQPLIGGLYFIVEIRLGPAMVSAGLLFQSIVKHRTRKPSILTGK